MTIILTARGEKYVFDGNQWTGSDAAVAEALTVLWKSYYGTRPGYDIGERRGYHVQAVCKALTAMIVEEVPFEGDPKAIY
jgi:hypothetical protein